MKTNKVTLTAALLMPAMLSLSMAQAAAPVQWKDLEKKTGRGKMRSDGRENRQYRVVTKDGTVHTGYSLKFSPVDVKVTPWEPSIPRELVTEIRIHRDGQVYEALKAPAGKIFNSLCGSDGFHWLCPQPLVPLFIPVAAGITVGAAPIILPIEGIKRLLPDKVIKVAP